MLARQKTESIVPERRLASHLSTILGIPQDDPDVERYLAALQAEGYRTTPSFDHLALGELAEKPFNFKAGDLKTVCLCMRAPMGVRGRRPWWCGSGGLGGGGHYTCTRNCHQVRVYMRVHLPFSSLKQSNSCTSINNGSLFLVPLLL